MSHKRQLSALLVASLALATALATLSPPVLAAACLHPTIDAVVRICNQGGQGAVKKAMTNAQDAANAAGERADDGKKFECKTCHKATTTFELNSNGLRYWNEHLVRYFK